MARVKYGHKELVAELENYLNDVEDWAKKGVAKTTYVINNTAKAKAPVDDGNLKKSIKASFFDSGYTGVVNVGAFYGVYVEFGTGVYAKGQSRAKKIPWSYQGADGKWYTTYGMKAQPYWYPSLDQGEKVFKRYFR
ncbi:HK97-gp10 family putative phage morphogenesis protein [Mammaliicoccus sciuri]|uniref:HK97-gp10 family putative phage morphogenesis protein n=1 Tax=Mammaliicoccus sciuri TaxID=1296 RepID=UPI0016281ACE|nr:HK97-gp10 family putative phage morphogenesis protein [Mammaliicoccus sciuri]